MKRLLCSLLFFGTIAHADDLSVMISGPDTAGVYDIYGYFYVDASTTTAWNVLTDYNHMSEFLPSVIVSTVIAQTGDHLLVRQTFVAKVIFFNHSADALFDIELDPNLGTINFRDTLCRDFKMFRGMWGVVKLSKDTGVIYRMQLIPSDSGPHFVIRNVSRRMAVTLLEQLRQEMEKRQAGR